MSNVHIDPETGPGLQPFRNLADEWDSRELESLRLAEQAGEPWGEDIHKASAVATNRCAQELRGALDVLPDTAAAALSDQEFAALLILMMCADPTPLTQEADDTMRALLDRESTARGYDGWIVAYHEFQPPPTT